MPLEHVITQISNDRFTAIALPLFLLAIVLEALISLRLHRQLYATKDLGVSVAMLLLSSAVDFLPKIAAFIAFFYLHELSPLRDVVQRQWWAWMILFTTGFIVLIMKREFCGQVMCLTIHQQNLISGQLCDRG